MFSDVIFQNIQNCAISEAQLVTGNVNWNVTLDELDEFTTSLLLEVCHDKRACLTLVCEISFGWCPVFSNTLSSNYFMEIISRENNKICTIRHRVKEDIDWLKTNFALPPIY